MAADFLSGFVGFILRHKLVVAFYLVVALLVFIYRKKFQFQLGFIAICRTKIGLGLMDRIASRHRELVRLLGYIGIGAGFIGMLVVLVSLVFAVFVLLTVPNSPAQIVPVIPGVQIPGVPESLFVPFVQGIVAIFIIAAVHEFSHGVVARAHNITIKSSGPAIVGPIFAAFVEPDEEQLKKKGDVINYSIFAAGSFSNFLLAFLMLALTLIVLAPVSHAFLSDKVAVISDVTPGGPAWKAGIIPMVVESVNGVPVESGADVIGALQSIRPNQSVIFSNGTVDFPVVAGAHHAFGERGYLGIGLGSKYVYRDEASSFFKLFDWIAGLIDWIFKLSIGIGLANMIPVGPLDGGKMLHLAMQRLKGEQKANKAFIRFSLVLLVLILFLLSPIFRAILESF